MAAAMSVVLEVKARTIWQLPVQPQANDRSGNHIGSLVLGCVFGGAQRLTAYIESVTLKLVLAKLRREWIL